MVTFQDAKHIANEIVSELAPLSIVVFGSVAKEGMGNDLDLFIVIDDTSSQYDAVNKLYKRLKPYYKNFAIDNIVVNQSNLQEYFEKGSPFITLIAKEGRSLYMRDAINEWIRQAEEELTMSKYLLDGGFFKGSCFHAQQSIEKAIKTNLLQKGWELEKTHNIARLVALCNSYHININLTDDEVVFIDSIYRGRYPADVGLLPLGEPKEDDAVKASAIAERILQHVKNNLQ